MAVGGLGNQPAPLKKMGTEGLGFPGCNTRRTMSLGATGMDNGHYQRWTTSMAIDLIMRSPICVWQHALKTKPTFVCRARTLAASKAFISISRIRSSKQQSEQEIERSTSGTSIPQKRLTRLTALRLKSTSENLLDLNDGPARTGAEPLNLCRRNTQTLTYAEDDATTNGGIDGP